MRRLELEPLTNPPVGAKRIKMLIHTGRYVLALDANGWLVRLDAPRWDAATRPFLHQGFADPVLTTDGELLVVVEETMTWRLACWEVSAWTKRWTVEGPTRERFAGVALAMDGVSIWLGADVTHDPLTDHHEARIRRVPLDQGGIGVVALSFDDQRLSCLRSLPDGRLVTSSDYDPLDLVDPATKTMVAFERESRGAEIFVPAGDGQTLISMHRDGPVRLWNTVDGTLRRALGTHEGYGIALVLLDGGTRMISAASKGTIMSASLTEDRKLSTTRAPTGIEAIAPLGATAVIALGTEGDLFCLDLVRNVEIARARVERAVPTACVALDAETVLVGFDDGSLRTARLCND